VVHDAISVPASSAIGCRPKRTIWPNALSPEHPITRNEVQLLRELTVAGEHGRVINTPTSSSRSEIAYLTSAHYIKRLSRTKLYVITERGREALKTIAD
jgi:hypothetical protein